MEASEQTATSKQLHLHAFGIDEIGQIGRKFNEMLIRNQILSERIVAESVKQKEAELSNLQAMINPHFLYNTLDCIYWNACINKDMDVANMALALSRIMRNSLNQGKFLSTVEQEFQLIESYLFIQKCRHKETLQHEVILDERLKKNKILKLILQPFVENAVLHGLEPKVGHGRIKVEGKLVGDEMVFTIWDDGVGMDAATLGKPGYGITNVKKRLELFYQGRYSLQIQAYPNTGQRRNTPGCPRSRNEGGREMIAKVLIIDDESAVIRGIRAMIDWKALGLELVGVAQDGESGLRLIRTLRPDLVITDIRMPGIYGLEMIRKANEINPGIQYIILSGYSEFQYAKEAIAIGVYAFLEKPVSVEELTKRLAMQKPPA